MRSLFQQFAAAVKELRDSLLDIPKKLSALDQDLKEQTKAVHEVRDAYKENRESAPPIRAEIQVSHPIEVVTSPKDKKQIREWCKLAIEGFTLLAVLAYTTVAALQWCTTKDILKQSVRQTELETRPYVGIEINDDNLILGPVTKTQVVFHNSGKLPAYADLFWGLAYSAKRSYTPNVIAHNERDSLLAPWPVAYPIKVELAGDVPDQTPKAQADAVQGMHSVGGFIYLWAQGRYGQTPDEATSGRYDTAVCTEYTILGGSNPKVGRIAPCPWDKSNYAY